MGLTGVLGRKPKQRRDCWAGADRDMCTGSRGHHGHAAAAVLIVLAQRGKKNSVLTPIFHIFVIVEQGKKESKWVIIEVVHTAN